MDMTGRPVDVHMLLPVPVPLLVLVLVLVLKMQRCAACPGSPQTGVEARAHGSQERPCYGDRRAPSPSRHAESCGRLAQSHARIWRRSIVPPCIRGPFPYYHSMYGLRTALASFGLLMCQPCT